LITQPELVSGEFKPLSGELHGTWSSLWCLGMSRSGLSRSRPHVSVAVSKQIGHCSNAGWVCNGTDDCRSYMGRGFLSPSSSKTLGSAAMWNRLGISVVMPICKESTRRGWHSVPQSRTRALDFQPTSKIGIRRVTRRCISRQALSHTVAPSKPDSRPR